MRSKAHRRKCTHTHTHCHRIKEMKRRCTRKITGEKRKKQQRDISIERRKKSKSREIAENEK